MLSLHELERAARLLAPRLAEARLDKLVVPDAFRVVLSFRGGPAADARSHVLLSCRPGSARLSLLDERPRAPRTPPTFAVFARKQLGRARCTGVRVVGGDRQVALSLRGQEGEYDLLLSILGPRSNVYLLDADGLLRQALRPLAKTRRGLALGEPWRHPETPAPAPGGDRFAEVPDDGFFAAVETHYREREGAAHAEELGRRLGRVLAREGRALERRRAALARDLEAARQAQTERRRGELLKASLDRVSPGAERVELEDWETGERVTVPLDPTLSPRENLEAIFRRYRKRTRSVEPLTRQIAELDARLADHRDRAAELETLRAAPPGDPAALDAFAARPPLRRLLERDRPPAGPAGRPRPARIAGRSVPARLVPRRYRTAAELEVWVGRSDEGNDFLTTRLARGNDLFLHLESSPGSHVVLRTGGRSDPPAEAVLDAAELAVHFSKHRDAKQADVHVVPIKNVHKPRGAKPGLVMVTGGRSLRLRREPARLERILDARIEGDESG